MKLPHEKAETRDGMDYRDYNDYINLDRKRIKSDKIVIIVTNRTCPCEDPKQKECGDRVRCNDITCYN